MSQPNRVVSNQTPDPIHPLPPTPIPEQPEKKPGSNLLKRLFTASILVPFVIYIIYLGGIVYTAVVVGFVLLGMREFYALIEEKGAHPLFGFGLGAGAALPIVASVGNEYHATILMTAVLLAVMVAQLGKQQISEALESISGTFFGIFYVGWLLSHAVVLRNFHDVVAYKMGEPAGLMHSPQSGAYYMIFALTCVVWCDAGAYFTGRAYGKRKLAPKISPKKTVEGAIGGLAAGTVGGVAAKAVFDTFFPQLSHGFGWGMAAALGFALSTVGIIGDLVESLLKRDAQVKDAGGLLPGMGGILDRLDAPLLGIPVMYYLLLGYTYLQLNWP